MNWAALSKSGFYAAEQSAPELDGVLREYPGLDADPVEAEILADVEAGDLVLARQPVDGRYVHVQPRGDFRGSHDLMFYASESGGLSPWQRESPQRKTWAR